ncbi:type II toxin-antitoxin system Phd/YefM family antitoxin [Paenibacillus tyrfis]|uniref:type II toxin-antitoxin system Phd/YefM family antitoxin n=1 Tax=Paenibacillus tyrfis TaxID=1501230 RepID=UPI00209F79C5|nr:type II toxin-antitoxin system Phd/YefM family antitoxin [Paenibacillus tyrfis]MCP1312075.1 type II toxin-antitoxin system Phd/YefM family antitoxin [Paenibacillus tyrfis]
MGTSKYKPKFDVDQLISSSEASKKFGEVRKRAKSLPQFITENGNVETVIVSYELFEAMYERLAELERQEELTLLQQIERVDQNPESSKSWKSVRRES